MRTLRRYLPFALLLLVVGIVTAVAYVMLQFNINATVQSYPKVTFWEWSTSTKKNTFEYSVNIFANVKTIDKNITYGIFNDASQQHRCYIRIKSLSNPTNIAELKITIYNDTNTILSKEWTNFGTLPTSWETFNTAPNAKYAISLEIKASASPSGSSTFIIEIREEN